MLPMVRWALLGGSAVFLTACGTVHNARMWFPNSFGMDAVNPNLYVEPAMSAEQRQDLQRQIEVGRTQVERCYGDIATRPYFVACVTDECAVRFGSYGERAAAFGDTAIRLSPTGLSAPLIAHEWSHAELYRRAGGWWHIRTIPRWFDEGVAVVVADESRHSEDNWREIRRRGLPTPPLIELISRGDWTVAVRKYGETKVDDPGNLRLVYSTAGHEVRAFLSCAGPAGVDTVLESLHGGESFDGVYARVGRKCVH